MAVFIYQSFTAKIKGGDVSQIINLGGGGGGSVEFEDATFRVYDDGDNTKKMAFEVSGVTAGATRTITMCDADLDLTSPSFGGTVTAATGMTITANDLTITSGNLLLPSTTSTDGQIKFNSDRMIHMYGNATDYNFFIGKNCGNTSLTTGTAKYNNGWGINTLSALTTGNRNLAFGSSALNLLTTGTYNCGFGNNTLDSLTTGSYNYAFGYNGGGNYTGSDSSNLCLGNSGTVGDNNTLRIGTQGTGNGQQDTTFIAGTYGVTPTGGNDGTVIIDSNGQLGSTTEPVGFLSINAQTGTSYTTVLADQNRFITMTNASASTLTIPPNSSVAYATGTVIYVQQLGAGQVTLTPGSGVTFRSADDAYKLVKQYSGASLIKIATDTWSVMGDVEA